MLHEPLTFSRVSDRSIPTVVSSENSDSVSVGAEEGEDLHHATH